MTDWNTIATELGYTDKKEMWTRLYANLSIAQLAARFATSQATIRLELKSSGIEMRSRGGSNNLKIEVTPALIEEVEKRGIHSVAKELNIDVTTLYKRLYYKHGIKLRELKKLQASQLPEPAPLASAQPEEKGTPNHDENQ